MVSTLTLNSFFSKYISDPLSNELSAKDKVIATVASLILCAATFSLIITLVSFFRNRTVKPLQKEDSPSANKVNEQAIIALQQVLMNGRNIRTIHGELDEKTRKAVTVLDLKDIEKAEDHLHELAEVFPNTSSINLSNKKLTDGQLSELRYFKALTILDLSTTEGASISIEDNQIKNLRPLFTLKMINLSGNKGLTGSTFHLLPENLTTFLAANCRITDEGVAALSNHKKLETLVLATNTSITGSTLNKISKTLQSINLTGCISVDVAHVQNTLKSFPNLKESILPLLLF